MQEFSKRGFDMIDAYYHYTCEPTGKSGIATYSYKVLKDGFLITQGNGLAGKAMSHDACEGIAMYTAILAAVDEILFKGFGNEVITFKGRNACMVQNCLDGKAEPDPAVAIHFASLKEAVMKCLLVTFETVPHDKNLSVHLDIVAFDKFVDKHPDIKRQCIEPFVASRQQVEQLDRLQLMHSKHVTGDAANRLLGSRP